jgi:hypothetical protein
MYDYQTSDLIFEKVLDSDRTITRDPVFAFLEQNGNFYYQTPLMSLSRTYHKTDDYGHTELIKQFTDVLQNYSIDESDDILTTLDTQKDNPRLLIILKNKIDGFTDKSPATTMGRLYSQMASNIVLADTLISRQERLSKRQITNTKLKDFTNKLFPKLRKNESGGDDYATSNRPELFISDPIASISIYPFSAHEGLELSLNPDEPPVNLLYHFVTQLNSYYFVDYEKLLNYKSQISKIFNPYNIIQIFGKGALAQYFAYKKISVLRPDATNFQYTTYSRDMVLNYSDGRPSNFSILYHPTEGQPNLVAGVEGALVEGLANYGYDKIVFPQLPDNDADAYKYAQLVQRYPNTIRNLGDYRISCFELTDFERPHATDHFFTDEFTFKVDIEDTTMIFYEKLIKNKITTLKERLKKYVDFAEDFCSFNNIDNRFNDFFVDNIRQQFTEPFPWTEAPLYYYLFSELINTSYSEEAVDNRNRNGLMLDLESIKLASLDMSKTISPETGDLNSLQIFYNLLQNFVNDYFDKGGLLDTKFNIYKETTNEFTGNNQLQKPSIIFSMEREDDYGPLKPVDYVDVSGFFEDIQEVVDARAAAEAADEAMVRKCYNYQVDWVNIQIKLWNRIAVIGDKGTKNKRQEEAGNLTNIRGWINDQATLKNDFQNDICGNHVFGPVKELSKSSYRNITLGQLDDLGYRTSISGGRATYTISGTDMNIGLKFVRNIINNGL